ncbi:STAS domain-containing protein [Actinoplanes subtropicus]|uniref:STAS domain-containing protein n=1 Tax=Actinoplanes subtropicus TaxID=543632 RepID=UPI001470674C|nr:STAS domain-containing protein [Actinoplanes subtropicus]
MTVDRTARHGTARHGTARHGTARIIVSGELDIATIAGLQAELDALLTHHPVSVEVDLSAVTFFSCAAAQTLRHATYAPPAHSSSPAPASRLGGCWRLCNYNRYSPPKSPTQWLDQRAVARGSASKFDGAARILPFPPRRERRAGLSTFGSVALSVVTGS